MKSQRGKKSAICSMTHHHHRQDDMKIQPDFSPIKATYFFLEGWKAELRMFKLRRLLLQEKRK